MKFFLTRAALLAFCLAASTAGLRAHGGHDHLASAGQLESLPEFKKLSEVLEQRPADLGAAMKLARICLDGGCPAHARGVLAPWWEIEDAPQGLLLLRATILQRDHEFAAALLELERLLALNPRHAEAWLMKSTIQAICGEYEPAYASALPLFGLASPMVAATATANVLSLSGKAEQSYALLDETLGREAGESPEVTAWAFSTLAEIAVRLGRHDEARRHFESALAAQPDNHYTRATYGEFLFDSGDARHAWKMLRSSVEGEAELLVLALIETRAGRRNSQFADELASGYSANTPTSRAAARYFLDVADEPQTAWRIAKANWDAEQREPADTLLALRAAEAAGTDAAEILRWVQDRRLEDVRLAPFISSANDGGSDGPAPDEREASAG